MKPRLWVLTGAVSIAAAIMALAVTPAVAQSRRAPAHRVTAASITLKYGYFGNAAELNAYK